MRYFEQYIFVANTWEQLDGSYSFGNFLNCLVKFHNGIDYEYIMQRISAKLYPAFCIHKL